MDVAQPAPGAPQGTSTVLWDFQVRDVSLAGVSADYWRGYYGYANGNVYQLDAAAVRFHDLSHRRRAPAAARQR